MLLLLNSDYGAMKRSLKLNRFLAKVWASRHIKCLTAICTHVALKLCNNKNLRYWLRLRWHWKQGYVVFATPTVIRGICDGLERKLT